MPRAKKKKIKSFHSTRPLVSRQDSIGLTTLASYSEKDVTVNSSLNVFRVDDDSESRKFDTFYGDSNQTRFSNLDCERTGGQEDEGDEPLANKLCRGQHFDQKRQKKNEKTKLDSWKPEGNPKTDAGIRNYTDDASKKLGAYMAKQERCEILMMSIPDGRIESRIEAFGHVAVELCKFIKPEWVYNMPARFLDQMSMVYAVQKAIGDLAAIAVSLLLCDYPVQVRVPDFIQSDLASLAFTNFVTRGDVNGLPLDQDGAHIFRLKNKPGVSNKTNVYASEAWERLRIEYPIVAELFRFHSHHMTGFYNDQAAACFIYAPTIFGDVKDCAEFAIKSILQPENSKGFGVALKGLGLNGTKIGSKLTESNVLVGRGTADMDLEAEARCRTDVDWCNAYALQLDDYKLRKIIRQVLEEELDEKPEFEDVNEFWSRRWGWMVNGSHNKTLGRQEEKFVVNFSEAKRLHRRVYAEEVGVNPAEYWSGKVYVTPSVKPEFSKDRGIYSVDSNTYINFEHLLGPVERNWNHKRAILDPGAGGTSGMARRMRRMGHTSAVKIMTDFEKFERHHSTKTMQVLFEELVKYTNYDKTRGAKLVNSFDDMHMHFMGEEMGKIGGTLMSGHRGTSFINTVLNYCYFLYFVPGFSKLKSIHTGDDSFVVATTFTAGAKVLLAMGDSDCRLNPAKQSFGPFTSEFLRMATSDEGTFGYVARSVAAIVMGNWVNDVKLSVTEALTSIVATAWSLCNRSMDVNMGGMLVSSFCRVTGLKASLARKLLTGETALNNGPSRAVGYHRTVARISVADFANKRMIYPGKNLASRAYLEKHLAPIESFMIKDNRVSVQSAMWEASYSKSIALAQTGVQEVKEPKVATELYDLDQPKWYHNIIMRRANVGIFEAYPVMNLLKNRIDSSLLRRAYAFETGMNPPKDYSKLYRLCWGDVGLGVSVIGWIPYSDAAALNRVMDTNLIRIEHAVAA